MQDVLFEKIKSGVFRFSPSLIWELISEEAKVPTFPPPSSPSQLRPRPVVSSVG